MFTFCRNISSAIPTFCISYFYKHYDTYSHLILAYAVGHMSQLRQYFCRNYLFHFLASRISTAQHSELVLAIFKLEAHTQRASHHDLFDFVRISRIY